MAAALFDAAKNGGANGDVAAAHKEAESVSVKKVSADAYGKVETEKSNVENAQDKLGTAARTNAKAQQKLAASKANVTGLKALALTNSSPEIMAALQAALKDQLDQQTSASKPAHDQDAAQADLATANEGLCVSRTHGTQH